MSRTLNADTLALFGDDYSLNSFFLFTFEFATVQRLTDHSHDINYDFGSGVEAFVSSARIETYSNTNEGLSLENQSMNIVLSGVNSSEIDLALSENYTNERVLIRRGFFDSDPSTNPNMETTDARIIADPFIYFDGLIDSYEIQDDPNNNTSKVIWKVASHWENWSWINGRKCNPTNAAYKGYTTETGFSQVYDQIGGRIWGRIVTS